MRELRLLADRGRTVVVVTHSVLHLDLCDHVLVMCLGGRMGYFGPPDELLKFFGAEDYADVFDKVTNDADRWAQLYRNSDIYRKYVGEVALEILTRDMKTPLADAIPTPRPTPRPVESDPGRAARSRRRGPAGDGECAGRPARDGRAIGFGGPDRARRQPVRSGGAGLGRGQPQPHPEHGVVSSGGHRLRAGRLHGRRLDDGWFDDRQRLRTGRGQRDGRHGSDPSRGSGRRTVAGLPGRGPDRSAGRVDAGDDAAELRRGTGPGAGTRRGGAGRPAPGRTGPSAAAVPAAVAPVRKAPAKPKSKLDARLDRLAAVVFRDSKLPPLPAPQGVQDKSMTQQALHPVAPLRQFLTLCLRMIAVIVSDRGYAAFLIGLPIALAALSRTVPGTKGLGPDPAGFDLEAERRLAVFIVGAAFMGIAISIREIINEASIYRRERAIGLSPTAYLASKVVIFVIIDTIQVLIFIYLSMLGPARPG